MQNETFVRRTVLWAGILGVIGVICGSLGAHGLEAMLADMGYDPELVEKRLDQFNTGVRYQMYHTVALVGVAALPFGSLAIRRWTGRLMIAGICLFSGSLYLLTLTNVTKWGMITPFGGLCWIIAWASLIAIAIGGSGDSDERVG